MTIFTEGLPLVVEITKHFVFTERMSFIDHRSLGTLSHQSLDGRGLETHHIRTPLH